MIGFWVQVIGVEVEYFYVVVEFLGYVYQDDVFGVVEGDLQFVVEVFEGGFQDVLGGFVGKVGSEGGKVERLVYWVGVLVLGGVVVFCGGNGSKGWYMVLNNYLFLLILSLGISWCCFVFGEGLECCVCCYFIVQRILRRVLWKLFVLIWKVCWFWKFGLCLWKKLVLMF